MQEIWALRPTKALSLRRIRYNNSGIKKKWKIELKRTREGEARKKRTSFPRMDGCYQKTFSNRFRYNADVLCSHYVKEEKICIVALPAEIPQHQDLPRWLAPL
ncbi:hypothetical protein CEXT_685271 [Caerostris extrusa]|uniref:Uncharacterized protein n=1 Tax=Caerostris extrusa TaxID=172846 RepID=A0AAV4TTE3_CAEEX|nr:hypothetical protein CEXT_685271 [Caerostris extrusa]